MASVIVCDRCEASIGLGHTQLRVLAGDLFEFLRDDPHLDLCRECAGQLLVWLESKPFRVTRRRPARNAS